MPTLESLDYERFSYGEADKPALTLDEAIKKAAELRGNDAAHYYRVEANDAAATSFRVEKVAVTSVYMDFMARVAKLVSRYSFSR